MVMVEAIITMEDTPICVADPYDLILDEGIDEVYRIMEPCRNCGELRPRGDLSMSINGICHLCRACPDARKRDTAEILAVWERMDEGAADGDEEGAADEHDDENDKEE
jgi:hypothetical protein